MSKLVSVIYYHDYILMFYDNGDIYKMTINEYATWDFTVQLMANWKPPHGP